MLPHWFTVSAVVLACLVSPSLMDRADPILVVGTTGEHIDLPCNIIPTGENVDIDFVRWADFVNNRGREPAGIYNSKLEPPNDRTHHKLDNFEVLDDYTLRILKLTQEDFGEYFCEVKFVDEPLRAEFYDLSVTDKPKCSGQMTILEGGGTDLICEMAYSSNKIPKMDWKDPVGEDLLSDDMTDITKFKKITHIVNVTADKDQQEYTCHTTLETLQQECSVKLDVQYTVRNIMIQKHKTHHAGQNIECSAEGNPAPTFEWTTVGIQDHKHQAREGVSNLVLREEWVGQKVTLTCTASNVVGTMSHHISTNLTMEVKEAKPKPVDEEKPGASTSGGVSTAGVIGGIIAAVVILIIIVAVIYVLKKRKSKKPKGSKPVPTKEQEAEKKDLEKA